MYESLDGYSKEDNTLKIVNLKQSEISLLKIVYQDLSRFIDEESKSSINYINNKIAKPIEFVDCTFIGKLA